MPELVAPVTPLSHAVTMRQNSRHNLTGEEANNIFICNELQDSQIGPASANQNHGTY
jgi:hypothetical protein